jgi:hypothetical protein
LITVFILLAGLWPFHFNPVNKVEWLRNEKGIRFYGQGIVYNADLPYGTPQSSYQSNPMSIELWLRSRVYSGRSISRILSLYDGRDEKFFIGQWGSHLILQSKTKDPNARETWREIGVDKALAKDTDRFVTITSGPEGTAIYLDGILAKSFPRFVPIVENRKTPGYLILGNSATGDQYWTGDLLGLAIYSRSLASGQVLESYQAWKEKGLPSLSGKENLIALYLFDERAGSLVHNHISNNSHLRVPDTFQLLRKTVLASPWKDFRMKRSYFKDVAINIAGFAPFGFFIALFLLNATALTGKRIYSMTVVLGAGISLIIELTQAWLPTRSSSLTDLICNVLGTVLGIMLLRISSRFLIARRDHRLS